MFFVAKNDFEKASFLMLWFTSMSVKMLLNFYRNDFLEFKKEFLLPFNAKPSYQPVHLVLVVPVRAPYIGMVWACLYTIYCSGAAYQPIACTLSLKVIGMHMMYIIYKTKNQSKSWSQSLGVRI